MDILQSLRNKVAEARQKEADLPREISAPMLDRIGRKVTGGATSAAVDAADVVVWCRAAWGSNCDYVNVA
jgi:hypothetical protein